MAPRVKGLAEAARLGHTENQPTFNALLDRRDVSGLDWIEVRSATLLDFSISSRC